mmetsp:Transcript_51232/g.111398  ORF Transcript_51232/g.111398 Transcript_51232/m.111398 type:complete len:314 (+) Transcript_51232:949-1890(+)
MTRGPPLHLPPLVHCYSGLRLRTWGRSASTQTRRRRQPNTPPLAPASKALSWLQRCCARSRVVLPCPRQTLSSRHSVSVAPTSSPPATCSTTRSSSLRRKALCVVPAQPFSSLSPRPTPPPLPPTPLPSRGPCPTTLPPWRAISSRRWTTRRRRWRAVGTGRRTRPPRVSASAALSPSPPRRRRQRQRRRSVARTARPTTCRRCRSRRRRPSSSATTTLSAATFSLRWSGRRSSTRRSTLRSGRLSLATSSGTSPSSWPTLSCTASPRSTRSLAPPGARPRRAMLRGVSPRACPSLRVPVPSRSAASKAVGPR